MISREVEALLTLFELNIGYDVMLFGDLYIRSLEDGRIAVGRYGIEDITPGFEELFDSLILAIDRFVQLRHELRYGLDYECQT